MNGNELRIGNKLYIPSLDTEVNVSAIFFTYFMCRDNNEIVFGESLTQNYQPIPLTEEWLLKFGFEKHKYLRSSGGNCWFLKNHNHQDGLQFAQQSNLPALAEGMPRVDCAKSNLHVPWHVSDEQIIHIQSVANQSNAARRCPTPLK